MTGLLLALALSAQGRFNCGAPNVRKQQSEYCECMHIRNVCLELKKSNHKFTCKTENQCAERARKK